MDDYESLSHTKWECKYHVVFIPKCRRKTLYAELRRHLGEVFRRLAQQKDCKIEEGHLLPDHVHMLIPIYPYALRTRKSAGLMMRKLSVTESQKTAQFFGTSSRRKCRTDRQKSL